MSNAFRETPGQTAYRQRSIQKRNQEFQVEQARARERAALDTQLRTYELGRAERIASGEWFTPETVQDLPYGESLEGKGVTRDIRLPIGLDDEGEQQYRTIQQNFVPRAQVAQAAAEYSPLMSRFRDEGQALDPSTFTDAELVDWRQMPDDIRARVSRPNQFEIDSMVNRLESLDPQYAPMVEQLRTDLTTRLEDPAKKPMSREELSNWERAAAEQAGLIEINQASTRIDLNRQSVDIARREMHKAAQVSAAPYLLMADKDEYDTFLESKFTGEMPELVSLPDMYTDLFELKRRLLANPAASPEVVARQLAQGEPDPVAYAEELLYNHYNRVPVGGLAETVATLDAKRNTQNVGDGYTGGSWAEMMEEVHSEGSQWLGDTAGQWRGTVPGEVSVLDQFKDPDTGLYDELRQTFPNIPANPEALFAYMDDKNDDLLAGWMAAAKGGAVGDFMSPSLLMTWFDEAASGDPDGLRNVPSKQALLAYKTFMKALKPDQLADAFGGTVETADEWLTLAAAEAEQIKLSGARNIPYEKSEYFSEGGAGTEGIERYDEGSGQPLTVVNALEDDFLRRAFGAGTRTATGWAWVDQQTLKNWSVEDRDAFEFARMQKALGSWKTEHGDGFEAAMREFVDLEPTDPEDIEQILMRMYAYLPQNSLQDPTSAAGIMGSGIRALVSEIQEGGIPENDPAYKSFLQSMGIALSMKLYGGGRYIDPIQAYTMMKDDAAARTKREAQLAQQAELNRTWPY